MKDRWFLPRDFFTNYKTDAPRQPRKKWDYKFKGYVCNICNIVFHFVPGSGYEPVDKAGQFPTIGKDRKVCKSCE
jgi:hypothetical protein